MFKKKKKKKKKKKNYGITYSFYYSINIFIIYHSINN